MERIECAPQPPARSSRKPQRFDAPKVIKRHAPSPPSVSPPSEELATAIDTDVKASQTGSKEYNNNLEFEMSAALNQLYHDMQSERKKNQMRYDTVRELMQGKDSKINELEASFAELTHQIQELEGLSQRDMNGEELHQMFLSIPSSIRPEEWQI